MTREILIETENALKTLAEFLKLHHSKFDVCMVDFITKDIFAKVLHKDLQDDMLKLSEQEIIDLPRKMIQNDLKRSSKKVILWLYTRGVTLFLNLNGGGKKSYQMYSDTR